MDAVELDSSVSTRELNGVVITSDRQKLATRVTLPAGSYLTAPVVLESPLLGAPTASVDGLPGLSFPVKRQGDCLTVELDPRGWPLTFHSVSHDYAIASPVEYTDGLEYVRRRHTVHADGSVTHAFDEHTRRGAGGQVEARAYVEVHCDSAGATLGAARVLERTGQETSRSALEATVIDIGAGDLDIVVQPASLAAHLKVGGWKGLGHWFSRGRAAWGYTSVNPDPRRQFPTLRWALSDPESASRLLASKAQVAPSAAGPDSPFREQLKVQVLEDSVRVGSVSLKKRKL